MPGHLDIAHRLAERILNGDPPPGHALPGVRVLARREGASASTVARAVDHLAQAQILETAPRRRARVHPEGRTRARALVAPEWPLRVAGSDDPALALLVRACAGTVELLPSVGSTGGLLALRDGGADAAVLHLWHAAGDWNVPYARLALDRRPGLLVHLWAREQGLVVPPGNPDAIAGLHDLAGRVVARRYAGSGTRALEARLLGEAGLPADVLHGPELAGHLEVAIAVASGLAAAGLGLRAAARALDLDFVPLSYEPFELVAAVADRPRLAAVQVALRNADLRRALEDLGGYDLRRSGHERQV